MTGGPRRRPDGGSETWESAAAIATGEDRESCRMNLCATLPPSVKSVAASLHGYRLQALRYGRETEELVGEALERETWCAERCLGAAAERGSDPRRNRWSPYRSPGGREVEMKILSVVGARPERIVEVLVGSGR